MKALYPVRIYYDHEELVYYADVPDLGLEGEKITYGASYVEVYENVLAWAEENDGDFSKYLKLTIWVRQNIFIKQN